MDNAMWLTDLGPYALFIVFAIYIILKDMGIIYKGRIPTNGHMMAKRLYKAEEAITRLSECSVRMETMIGSIHSKTDELHKWHDIVDTDGVKIWYVRKSLEDAIVKLADNIAMQTEILRELITTVRHIDEDVKALKAKL